MQIWLVDRFRERVDPHDAIIVALENGEDRRPETLELLVRLGLLQGIPDLLVLYGGGRSLFLEVKLEHTAQHPRTHLRPSQRALHASLQALGHAVATVRNSREFWQAIDRVGIPHAPPPPEQLMLLP